MAFAARFLSRSSRQVCAGQSVLRSEYAVPARSFAKGAGGPPPSLKGDEILKGIFLDVIKKFKIGIGVLKREKITIDPDDPAAVAHYAKVIKTIREEAGLLTESQKCKFTMESRTKDIPDVRSCLLALEDIWVKGDERGIEAMLMDALNKVEKELKKPLLRNDEKGMPLFRAEVDKILQKLGISREDLPKLEEKLDLKIAKAQLEELKKDCIEAMEAVMKKEEFKDEKMPDVRSLDIRNFL